MSPREIVQGSIPAGLTCLSITDHDTVDGIDPAISAAKDFDIEVIPGIELSAEMAGKDIHILGYFLDHQNKTFILELQQIQEARQDRIRQMIQNLKKQGIDNIDFEEVASLARSKSVGRPHLAMMLQKKGWVGSIRGAFDKYIGEDCLAYVEKFKQTPYEAIGLIRKFGGVAVLAHPMVTLRDELIPSFVDAGLSGLEVFYPNQSSSIIKYYQGLAVKYNLIMTGGSDFHGENKDNTYLGKSKVSYQIVEDLKIAAGI